MQSGVQRALMLYDCDTDNVSQLARAAGTIAGLSSRAPGWAPEGLAGPLGARPFDSKHMPRPPGVLVSMMWAELCRSAQHHCRRFRNTQRKAKINVSPPWLRAAVCSLMRDTIAPCELSFVGSLSAIRNLFR
jgi:hypothetical protein